jgi:hypothetical protein
MSVRNPKEPKPQPLVRELNKENLKLHNRIAELEAENVSLRNQVKVLTKQCSKYNKAPYDYLSSFLSHKTSKKK